MIKKDLVKKLQPILAGFLITALAFWFENTTQPALSLIKERINNLFYDVRTRLHLSDNSPHTQVKSNVVIVDIDEKSLNQLGRWPWPRVEIAKLIDKLQKLDVVLIGLDIVFPEREKNIVDVIINDPFDQYTLSNTLLQELTLIKKHFDYDEFLAQTVKNDNIVLGYVLSPSEKDQIGELPSPIDTLTPYQATHIFIRTMNGFIGINKTLLPAVKSSGFVTTLADNDGVIRHYPIVLRYGNNIYPSLALTIAKEYLLVDEINLNWAQTGQYFALDSIDLDNLKIPTDGSGQILIPYFGNSGSHTYVSAIDVLKETVNPQLLAGKIVIIGTSAIGLGDLHTTPFETSYPGAEIHATVVDAILNHSFPYKPDWATGAQLFLLVVIAGGLSIALPFMPVLGIIALPLITLAGFTYFNEWLWFSEKIYLSSFSVILAIIGVSIVNLAYSLIFEVNKRIHLKRMFGQYVPSEHVEKMMGSDKNYSFEGESREMSVLFADIRNFTAISENLDPVTLKRFLNDYFTPMTKTIFEHGGTIDKYVGDMIMAFWGAPLENKNHALDAVTAGFSMLQIAESLKNHFEGLGVHQLNIGIGVNTGKMNVGDMGSEYRRSYTVLGDAVNLSSRLESSTKFYGAPFIISESTLRQCRGEVIAMHLDKVRVKGKHEPINIYAPICFRKAVTPAILDELRLFTEAQHHYFKAEWSAALTILQQLHERYPEQHLYKVYIERIIALKNQNIQAPWDGVYVREEK